MSQQTTSIEAKLGFDLIREQVSQSCANPLARQMTAEMAFSTHYDHILHELQQTDEMRRLLLFETAFPRQDFYDLTGELQRLQVQNTVITLEALFDMKTSLHTIGRCLQVLLRDEDPAATPLHGSYPLLRAAAQQVLLPPALSKTIDRIVDDQGGLYDTASDELHTIRRSMVRKRGEMELQVSRALSRAKREGWAPEDAEATIRNGRPVIPMLGSYRRRMSGIIQDESATRQTAYLEPAEVVELGNDLRELEFAERHEIQRILRQFTEQLRPHISALLQAYWFLARMDFLRAKALLAQTLQASLPVLSPEPHMQWVQARHPLLFLSKGDAVVPFDLQLTPEQHILVISGPNAGGKSVCLKSIGLIQYMLQCGMLVPCLDSSEFGIFRTLFIDIGDEQSIENDLSTYSSHLQNMKQLLAEADGNTLFLLDELGGGTDPRSGSAIGGAVLEELCRRHSYGVVTTHYADLKLLADTNPGIVNGAMLFDTHGMRPLYRLSIGHPGSSFAFEMAKNIGLPPDILSAAEQKVGTQQLNFEHQLQQMELDKQEIARKQQELVATDTLLNEVVEKYRRLTDRVEEKRFQILSQARQEASRIIEEAGKTVEHTVADIRRRQADKEATRQAREQLQQAAEQLQQQQTQHHEQRRQQRAAMASTQPPTTPVGDDTAPGTITPGDIVRIDGQAAYAQVASVKGNKAVVESQNIRMTIPLSRLTKTNKQHLPTDKAARQNSRFLSVYDDLNEKRNAFKDTLDLRGMRTDEAIAALQRFLDDARLLSEHQVRILHGKGYGILKTMIRQELQRHPEVSTFRSEKVEFGGDGITIVELK